MPKKETKKKVKEEIKKNGLMSEIFLDKEGNEVKILDVIDKEDCWFLKKANAWILSHKAIQKIANIAGISKNYDVHESNTIFPTYKNDLEHIVRVTIKCNATKGKKDGTCIHSDENTLTVTGESNRTNTPDRGRGYLRKMAEKRAYDIAVLEHLNLSSKVFSEEESPEFENKRTKEPILMPGTQEFERINKEVNAILNSKTLNELKKIGNKIKAGVDIQKYSEKQIEYLRSLYKKELGKKELNF
jgi:hypothetical protein